MPNYCENQLKIMGDTKELLRLQKKVSTKKEIFSFETFKPTPTLFLESDKWYTWRLKNWGTKWNACEAQRISDADSGELLYSFDTAWSPPVEAIATLSKKFRSLIFFLDYDEPGVAFRGTAYIKAGKVDDKCFSY